MVSPDAGLADKFDPHELREIPAYAMCTCGVASSVRRVGDFLFPARRRIVVRVSSRAGAADDASFLTGL
jgi:hypothetical protein